MSQPAVDECPSWRWNVDFDRFKERWGRTCSTHRFPDCASIGAITRTLIRTKQRWRSICVQTFCCDNKCRNILRTVAGISHNSVRIKQFFFDEGFNCRFKFLIVEATLIVTHGDNAILNLIDLENRLR
jgi:hypothetical protein